ncbi:hypothetical protein NPIL_27061 [Nephila pilipes]|uniref:Uncharacterized protein n=1 Tax=Nephila pilipes TaxID=299642 RepID=A0A8X6Q155_NEPPI|nr:hypothetical protein NPIL_27061 [Nephila pilipes]
MQEKKIPTDKIEASQQTGMVCSGKGLEVGHLQRDAPPEGDIWIFHPRLTTSERMQCSGGVGSPMSTGSGSTFAVDEPAVNEIQALVQRSSFFIQITAGNRMADSTT